MKIMEKVKRAYTQPACGFVCTEIETLMNQASGSAGTNLAMVFLKSAKDTRDCSFSPSECRTVVSKNLYYRLFDLLLTFYADYFIHYSYNY